MWVTNTTTWYEFELSPEEREQYLDNPDAFIENNDVFGSGEVVREKHLDADDVDFFDDDEEEDEFED